MVDMVDTQEGMVRVEVASHVRFVKAFAEELQLRDPQGNTFDDEVDPVALARAAACRLIDTTRAWHEHLGPVYDTDGVASLLGPRRRVSRQAVHKRRLLALKTGSGRVVYPAFQFDETGTVVDGVPELVKMIDQASLSLWALASWLASPEREFDGDRPIDVLRCGGKQLVLSVASRWLTALT